MPLTGLLIVAALHWDSFISLFGLASASFALTPKGEPLPVTYIAAVLSLTLLFEVLPYLEELVRSVRCRSAGRVS